MIADEDGDQDHGRECAGKVQTSLDAQEQVCFNLAVVTPYVAL